MAKPESAAEATNKTGSSVKPGRETKLRPKSKAEPKTIKCLVWDLDNTLWDGTILEGGDVKLREGVEEVIRELDRRGILLSVASKNEPADALAMLERFGLKEYFLVPQIGWGSKSDSMARIAKLLNLGLDAFAFIDDQPAEREEVRFHYPQVRVHDAADYRRLPDLPEFTPQFITDDSRLRRRMYLEDLKRQEEEQLFGNDSEAFLKTLDMHLTLSPVKEGDLERVEELTLRTNQLNSTGATYDYEELRGFIRSRKHLFLIAELTDRFGSYGKIGLALAEKSETALTIKLLLMSCRVMTRGIGSALLVHLARAAQGDGLELLADFVETGRNRIMYITYKLMGFEEIRRDGEWCLLRYAGGPKDYPEYLRVEIRP